MKKGTFKRCCFYPKELRQRLEYVDGYEVPNEHGLKLFAYKNKSWYVCEQKTGLAIGYGKTKKAAIEHLNERLKGYTKGQIEYRIRKQKKKHKIAHELPVLPAGTMDEDFMNAK